MLNSNKSIIVNPSSEVLAMLGDEFKAYVPKKGSFSKVATLGKFGFDNVYFINIDSNVRKEFVALFKTIEEDVILFNKSFDEKITKQAAIAYELATYQYEQFKKSEKVKYTLEYDDQCGCIEKGRIYGKAICNARDLVNAPSNLLTTEKLCEYASELASNTNTTCEIIGKDELIKMEAGGILAVNAGSFHEAKLIVLKYQGLESFDNPVTLVGKGLIFDTGGYSLKPSTSIIDMKSDMAGAATMLSVFEIIAKLKPEFNLLTIVPVTDNLVNELAYRPDDVITLMNKLTVEIKSTDAEGRLILADALTYSLEYKPQVIFDAATLTGAVVAALGDKTTGVFTNTYDLANEFVEYAISNDELAWVMPLNDYHRNLIKSPIADMKNTGGPLAGSSTAAAFLEKCVNDSPWIHLDIAGSAFSSDGGDYASIGGATGSIILSLAEFLIKKY